MAASRRRTGFFKRDTGYDSDSASVGMAAATSDDVIEQLSPEKLQAQIDSVEREIVRLSSAKGKLADGRRGFSKDVADNTQVGHRVARSVNFNTPNRLTVADSVLDRSWPQAGLPVGYTGQNTDGMLCSEVVRCRPPAGQSDRLTDQGSLNDHFSGNEFSKRILPTIKLSRYDGLTPLETHLDKYENCADYHKWGPHDRLCHLKASLDGHAGQVLWEAGDKSTEKDIVELLRNRFGNVNQTERYRAELRNRRRKRGESIQAVYQDI
jgi:hypothetical protein